MKRSLGSKRLTKRKTNKDILLLKNFNAEVELGKDILQVVQEKLIADSQSVWHGAEILYVVESVKRNKIAFDQSGKATNNVKNKSSKSKSYLIIVMRKDTGINILLLTLKDGDLDLKNNCEPKFLRGIDFGSDDSEIVLSFDSGDLNVVLTSQTDRDEAVWVIFQICKSILGIEISLGYSVDIEAISFKTTTNSTLARFPSLNKLISAKHIQTGDVFSDEEAEAEHLLDELNWSAGGTNGQSTQQADLQLLLSAQSDQLKFEIIDFLLQWEEMDSVPNNAPAPTLNQPQQHSHNPVSLLNIANIKSNLADLKKNIGLEPRGRRNSVTALAAAATAPVVTGVRDTREVLNALALVDFELEAVDNWLGDQIERLSEIKVNLSMIEDESGALETSWKSLNNVQEIINYIVKGYSIDNKHQELLRQHPEVYFGSVIKGMSMQGLPGLINPLVEALTALRKALDLKSSMSHFNIARMVKETNDSGIINTVDIDTSSAISPAQWKQLQSISAITTQRVKLQELSDMFCRNFGEFAVGLFDMVLKHKALSDPSSGTTISIKQFSFQSLVDEFVLERLDYEVVDGKADFSRMKQPLKMATQKNQFLQSVKAYHSAVSKFASMLDIFIELAPNYSKPICESYVKSTQERLYIPLAKVLFKDLQNIVMSGKLKITLATCSNYHFDLMKKGSTGHDVNFLRFRHDAQLNKNAAAAKGGTISSWMALRIALIILAPIFETEEKFMKTIFHNRRHFIEQSGHKVATLAGETAGTFGSSKLSSLLHSMFENVVSRFETHILHCSSSSTTASGSDQVDGIECIAMLTILHEFSLLYTNASPFLVENIATLPNEKRGSVNYEESLDTMVTATTTTTESAAGPTNPPISFYLVQVFDTLRNSLLSRLHVFVNEQISWINSQKCDPKSSSVLLPFSRFPTLIVQAMEMSHGMQFEHVDDMLHKLAKELFSWLTLTAKQSDKYCDKIKITNFTFFEKSVGPMNIGILENFVIFAGQQRSEAVSRYVNWMVSYEFPALSALAVRMDGVGNRVNEEELSLYIRRKDVLNVVKEIENVKALEANIVTLRKRLEKHFLCEAYVELNLVAKGWQQIKNRVISILSRLEDAATASYQINLDVGPKTVQDLFDKYSDNTLVL